jgi:hypothetical protein
VNAETTYTYTKLARYSDLLARQVEQCGCLANERPRWRRNSAHDGP